MSLLRQYELLDKIAELQKQIDVYKKELLKLQYENWNNISYDTIRCQKCGADRAKSGCRLINKMECAMIGKAQGGSFK